ncbi:hypothetical protein WN944_006249 [Citrus x changshan-huyou]|uniref:Uncharacterized protein n=1 Tax=Citrus x changshan-huyou TaxID=2935761 RepID=A0AAP0QT23_9ROSI
MHNIPPTKSSNQTNEQWPRTSSSTSSFPIASSFQQLDAVSIDARGTQQRLPGSRVVPAASSIARRSSNLTQSRSTHEQQFQQLPQSRAVPAACGSTSSSNNFRQPQQFPANRVCARIFPDLRAVCVFLFCSCVCLVRVC